MYYNIFGTQEKYTGSAEQNIKFLEKLQLSNNGARLGLGASQVNTITPKPSAKASISGDPAVDYYIQKELQDHDKYMIVNKANNTMYYGKPGESKKMKVGLGKNNKISEDGTAGLAEIERLEKAGKFKEADALKRTAMGSKPMVYDSDIYGKHGFRLPGTNGEAIHARYSSIENPKEYQRRKDLEKQGIWNYSYGCTNVDDEGNCTDGNPLDNMVNYFSHDPNKPDTARYIDTRLPVKTNENILNKNKKTSVVAKPKNWWESKYGGGCDDCMHKMQAGGIDELTGLSDEPGAMPNVIAESGEIVQGHDGGIAKISDNEKTHEQGGVKLGNVNKVLEDTSDKRKDEASKLLRMSPEEVENLFGFKPKSYVSHAKAFELAVEHYNKISKKIQNEQKVIAEKPHLDKIAVNTAKLNYKTNKDLPGKDDIYDALFLHQEQIKKMNNIQNDGKIAKTGGKISMKAQAGAWANYYDKKQRKQYTAPTDVTPEQFYTPEVVAYMNTLDKLPGVDNDLGVAKDNTWGYRHQMAYDKFFGNGNKPVIGKDLGTMPRTLPSLTGASPAASIKFPGAVSDNGVNTDVTINPKFINQPKNEFNEPTYWDDIAPSLLGLADSFNRDPELFNPTQFNQLKYKQLDPTPALNANQADYNAALEQLGNIGDASGTTAANIANLQAQKYNSNGQILGNYENQNSQIKNNEITYNTNVKDRQNASDAQTRATYHRNVQLGREAQREQRLKSIEDISRVVALKRRQNASGNRILKLTPAFNQKGEYNGYQYVPVLPGDVQANTNSKIVTTGTGKKWQIITDANGKELSRVQIS